MKWTAAILALVVTALVVPFAAPAAAPGSITLFEHIDFHPGVSPPSGTFTVSGLAGCTGGTVSDRLVAFGGDSVIIDRIYSCSSGASLTARIVLVHGAVPDPSSTLTAPWTLLGGTGALAGIRGHGTSTGVPATCAPGTLCSEARITALVQLG